MPKPVRPAAGTVTVHVPIAFRRGRGSNIIAAPDGSPTVFAAGRPRMKSALAKAIGRAFRWRKLLETGAYDTIHEIATVEKVNPSYVGRILRLTLLAPDLVEAILDGSQASIVTTDAVMRPLPADWAAQRHALRP